MFLDIFSILVYCQFRTVHGDEMHLETFSFQQAPNFWVNSWICSCLPKWDYICTSMYVILSEKTNLQAFLYSYSLNEPLTSTNLTIESLNILCSCLGLQNSKPKFRFIVAFHVPGFLLTRKTLVNMQCKNAAMLYQKQCGGLFYAIDSTIFRHIWKNTAHVKNGDHKKD